MPRDGSRHGGVILKVLLLRLSRPMRGQVAKKLITALVLLARARIVLTSHSVLVDTVVLVNSLHICNWE